MYSAIILILGIVPTVLLFAAAQFDKQGGVGPSPMKILAWTWLLGYTLKSIYLSFAVVYQLPFRPDWIAFSVVDIGQWAIVLGTIAMIVGYFVATIILNGYRGVTLPPRRPSFDVRIIYYPMFVFSVVLLSLFFYRMGFFDQLRTGRLLASKFFIDDDGNRSALGFLSIGGDFLLVFFIYYLAMARKITWINIYTISIAFFALTLFLGSRRNVILIIVILALIVLAVRNVKVNVLRMSMRFGLVGLILIGTSLASQIRTVGGREGLSVEQLDIAAGLQQTAIHAFKGAYFIDPAKTAAIVVSVDSQRDLFWGASFLGFVIAPIPRVLWPEKPSVRVAPYVAQELFNYNNRAGVTPGAVGEFYLNFGWFGISAGMFLMGMFPACIWWWHRRSVDPRFTIVPYAFLMIIVIYFLTVEFSAAVVIWVKYYIAILVAKRYWARRLHAEEKEARYGRRNPDQSSALDYGEPVHALHRPLPR